MDGWVRLDGALNHLYPRISPGGFVIMDDYGAAPACKQTIHDSCEKQGIREEIKTVDWTGAYWQ